MDERGAILGSGAQRRSGQCLSGGIGPSLSQDGARNVASLRIAVGSSISLKIPDVLFEHALAQRMNAETSEWRHEHNQCPASGQRKVAVFLDALEHAIQRYDLRRFGMGATSALLEFFARSGVVFY